MNVAVCSWNSPEFADLAAVSAPGKQEYCDRHDYKFVHVEEPFVDGWQRYDLVAKMLPHFDMVLSLDADAMIMNHTIRADRKYIEGKFLYITDDLWGLNDGSFIIVKTHKSMQMLGALLGMGRHPGNKDKDTQQLLRWFVDFDPYKEYVYKERQTDMNSYRNDLYGRPPWFDGTFEKGDWILQFPGLENKVRLPLMKEALAQVVR